MIIAIKNEQVVFKQKQILIIDDSACGWMLEEFINYDEGFNALSVKSITQASELLNSHDYDWVVMDGMNGKFLVILSWLALRKPYMMPRIIAFTGDRKYEDRMSEFGAIRTDKDVNCVLRIMGVK